MTNLTRRRLLEQAAAAALAPGAERLLPRPAARKLRAASDRLQVACVGVHGRGMDHIHELLAQPDVDIVAICDVDAAVAARGAAAVAGAGRPRPAEVTDIRDLLHRPALDAVTIATPNHWHALAAVWSMEAGKDVYVEKPVSHQVREGRVMVETARRLGRICQTGTQIRSSAGSRSAIDFIHAGGIGRVTIARGLCYKRRDSIGIFPDSPVPPGVDYDLWLGPAPVRPFNRNRFHYNWHWWWSTGNGDIGNQGIHQMDVARWALGRSSLPGNVFAYGGRYTYTDAGETPNTLTAVLGYGLQAVVFEVRGLKTDPLRDVKVGNVIEAEDGIVAFTSYDTAVALDRTGRVVRSFAGGGDHFANFVAAVRSRRREDLHADILEGHLSSAMCHLANISYRLGPEVSFDQAEPQDSRWRPDYDRFRSHLAANGVDVAAGQVRLGRSLTVDARHERFEGDADANGMLTRQYRAPFVLPEHG